jgi:hypothetical protein
MQAATWGILNPCILLWGLIDLLLKLFLSVIYTPFPLLLPPACKAMPSLIGVALLAVLLALVACNADSQVSEQSASTDASTSSAAVNTTADCLPGFERHASTGACFQPPTCFLPMILSDERDKCICTPTPATAPSRSNMQTDFIHTGPASEPTHKDYWGGFRVINGMWCAVAPLLICHFCVPFQLSLFYA